MNHKNKSFKNVQAIFYLPNKDTITIEGTSVLQIFFEMQRRFPEGLKYNFVGFSGNTQEERFQNVKKFITIQRKYGG